MIRFLYLFAFPAFLAFGALADPKCKTIPSDSDWPSDDEWAALNESIDGTLIKAIPVASSCWPGNPFNSTVSCEVVKTNWTLAAFHSEFPESIDYPIYANNSCLPPGATGYDEKRGCSLGGLPEYVVNATSKEHVATAMKWASQRNLRITVKGTGHDLNGRSSGAYAISIWTRNLNKIEHNTSWPMPNGEKENVLIVGSGTVWGDVYRSAVEQGRIVVGGQDRTVGLGGYIQGGGHGPLSSTYGLAAQQVLQVTVVTTEGKVLVANDGENQDLFWAVRGGGAGQYGVITEYVLKTHPAPEFITTGTLQIKPTIDNGNFSSNATWDAAATLFSSIPDLMDSGLAGASTLATGTSAMSFDPSLTEPLSNGVVITQVFFGYNVTSAAMTALIDPVISRIRSHSSNSSLTITWAEPTVFQNFTSFLEAISGTSNAAGAQSVVSTRLLGRAELSELPQYKLASFLQRALRAQNETAGTYATIGLQGGPGPASVSEARWGSVNPAWRSAYLHVITAGAAIDSTTAGGPKEGLALAADWMEENKEALFREWAPNTGAYMNEANPYDTQWKQDFYGEPYEKLLAIKRKYDPTESLYVLNGVGSDEWDYDLDSGTLCRKA